MKNIISHLKKLSCPGVLLIYLGYNKIRLISSSNVVSSLQRVLPELKGTESVEVLYSNTSDKKLRSLLCFIEKKRLERLSYKVDSSIKSWRLNRKIEEIDGEYKWVLRAANSYTDIVIGVFEKEEMEEFCKAYYPGGVISGAIISSNSATKRYYEIH